MRSLIGRVVLTPGPKGGGVVAALHGDLAAMLSQTSVHGKGVTPGSVGVTPSVVAGRGFEPLTFRL